VKSLASQAKSFNTLLAKVPALSGAASDLVNQVGPQLDTQLNQLQPVMATLSGFDDRLGSTLKELNAFHGLLDKAIPGDYLELDGVATVDGTIAKLLTTDPQCVMSRSCSTSGGSGKRSPGSANANKNGSATSGGSTSSGNGILSILGAGLTGEGRS
jgi:ABC-type transporter Mla subunit MlaD